jgi:hypothetical protein
MTTIRTATRSRLLIGVLSALLLLVVTATPASAIAIETIILILEGVTATIGLTTELVALYNLTESENNVPDGTVFTQTVSGSDTDLSVTYTWVGPLDDGDVVLPFSGTAFGTTTTSTGGTATVKLWSWVGGFTLFDDQGVYPDPEQDIVQIVGLVQHEIGPDPGDNLQGPQLTYNLSAKTIFAPFEKTATGAGGQLDHPPSSRTPKHVDQLPGAFLSGTVNHVTTLHHELTGFTFQLTAKHQCLAGAGSQTQAAQQLEGCPCESCPAPIPGPATVLLVSTGWVALVAFVRLRERRRSLGRFRAPDA